MARIAREMSALEVSRLNKPGTHAVGGVAGLCLQVNKSGAKSWILRAMVGTKRKEQGLGGYPTVPLGEARKRAREAREIIDAGGDPLAIKERARRVLREQQRTAMSFREAALHVIAIKSPAWKNAKHRAQWSTTLEAYAYPVVGNMPVGEIEQSHVLQILQPIWKAKPETASRVRSRIESVLDWAKAHDLRAGENPARWRGQLEFFLAPSSRVKKRRHHRALPIDDTPAFFERLRLQTGIAARALEFTILTAARSGEVYGATWGEIDFRNSVWKIAGDRMKAGHDHRAPLSTEARAVLEALPRPLDPRAPLFASASGNKLSNMAMTATLRRMAVNAVPHGFRSTFKDWATDRTEYDSMLSEMALAHQIPNKVEAAYRRSDLLERRRPLMEEWARFLRSASRTYDSNTSATS